LGGGNVIKTRNDKGGKKARARKLMFMLQARLQNAMIKRGTWPGNARGCTRVSRPHTMGKTQKTRVRGRGLPEIVGKSRPTTQPKERSERFLHHGEGAAKEGVRKGRPPRRKRAGPATRSSDITQVHRVTRKKTGKLASYLLKEPGENQPPACRRHG